MAIVLKDSSGNTLYTFGKGVNIEGYPLGKRIGEEEIAYQNGTIITSDKKLKSRLITLSGILNKTQAGVDITTSAAFEAELEALLKAVNNEDMQLYGYKSNKYINLDCLEDFDHEWIYANKLGFIELIFIASDPHWYYKNETTDNNTVDESPEEFTVTNGGDIAVFPVITFTCGAGSDISKIKISNDDDAGKYFEYEPASNLGSGDIVEVDCKEGTVELNGSDDMAHFNDGSAFLKLVSGDNDITVTITGTVGTNTCKFVFRKKYL